jgi:hypothetical protein
VSGDEDKEELRLNTLHRFAKRSSRLVLQEYSHCEVPAGCGGYVFRWRNPESGLPLTLHISCHGETELWIDGRRASATHVDLPFGEHALALHVRLSRERGVLVFAAARALPDEEDGPLVCRTSEGGWRLSATAPAGDGWLAPGFDDGAWTQMRATDLTADVTHDEAWRYEYLVGMGADALLVPTKEAWIRHVFRVERSLGERR